MNICSMTLSGNDVIVSFLQRPDVVFRCTDEHAMIARFNKMCEDLPELVEELVLSGAFEELDEEDII